MSRSRLIAGLRLGWTFMFGLFGLALMLLSVRSYSYVDWLRMNQPSWSVASFEGRLRLNDVYNLSTQTQQPGSLAVSPSPAIACRLKTNRFSLWTADHARLVPVGVGSSIPLWPLVPTTAVLTAVPWIRRRFSLRTLLIATTLVAVLLGIVAAMW